MAYSGPHPLDWIDEYVERIGEYVTVRERDCLLIKMPNEAYRLNPSGVRTMKHLLGGGRIGEIWKAAGGTDGVRRELYEFFVGLKQVLTGCIDERRLPNAVRAVPFALGFSELPVLSEVALTYRCNLSCRFCYAGCSCSKREHAGAEMPTEDVKRVLTIIREDAEVPSVSFTGGEPTLRADLAALIEFARARLKMRVNLITNGTLVDRAAARELARTGLDSAQVSLEAPDERTHERLTRVAGSFEKTVAAVGAFASEGIHVHTNTTITRLNADAARRMPAFAKELGLSRLSMNMVIPAGASRDEDDEVNLRYEEMPPLLDDIRAEAERAGVAFMWYSPTPICIYNPIPRALGNKGCSACDGLLSVSPAGDVLPCSSWPEPVGNILSEGFDGIWQSARGQWLRAKSFADDLCASCGDFAACQGACPLYWRHFGRDELERHGVNHASSAC